LRGDYFVLGTLGFQVIVYGLLYNWVGLTNGSFGLSNIPVPVLFGMTIDSVSAYFCLAFCLCAVCVLIAWGVARSPFGRLLRAIRDDEIAAIAIAKNTVSAKTSAFALSAALAAVPGALFAGYARFIDPTSFTLAESILVLSMVVIGGAGSIAGPLVGSLLLVLMPEGLRYLQVQDAVAANARQIAYGLALVVLMRLRPQGMAGEYHFD
jgi:branched-chain amino acid transport system permease protein